MNKTNETTTGAGPTPGPWTAPSAGIWTADGECLIATLGSRECVASRRAYARKHYGDGPNCTRAEMELLRADAALVAAAPELLAALKELERLTVWVGGENPVHDAIEAAKACSAPIVPFSPRR